MDNEIRERLKEIETEDVILGIFIILIILTYLANQAEKRYFIAGEEEDKKTYYYTQIIVFLVATLVSIFYVVKSYQEVISLENYPSSKKKNYAHLSFISSIAALIASSIILYIAVTDTEIDAEITI